VSLLLLTFHDLQVLNENKKRSPSGPTKPVSKWNNQDVVQWLRTVDLESKRSQYVVSFMNENITGVDLLAVAADGEKNFAIEMHEDYKIIKGVGRRMFRSLAKYI